MQQGPVCQPIEVAIVGAGFGGLCLAIKLLEAGIRDFVVLEKGEEVGGTWRDNTYPGAECDVQSHLYSYSFEAKPNWSQRYAGWREIQSYILDTTDKYGLRPYIRFQSEVCGAHFDEATARWTTATTSPASASPRSALAAAPSSTARRSRPWSSACTSSSGPRPG